VPEIAVREDRQGQERRIRQVEHAQEVGQPELGDIQFTRGHALENVGDQRRGVQGDVGAGDRDPPVEQRLGVLVAVDAQVELRIGHGSGSFSFVASFRE
jgi:hypothetical protein